MGRTREPPRFSDAQIAATSLADADADCWAEEERLLRRAVDNEMEDSQPCYPTDFLCNALKNTARAEIYPTDFTP
jgi:hypothetical protein